MQGIGDRVILWLCCLVLAVYSGGISILIVLVALLAFTMSCFGMYINNKSIRMILIFTYTILSFYFIEFVMFFPVILYELLNVNWEVRKYTRRSDSNEYEINILIYVLVPAIVMGISVIYNFNRMDQFLNIVNENTAANIKAINILSFIGITCISIWFNIFCHYYTELKKEFIISRDNSAELTLALKNKNRFLIEKQDSEIYLATLRERNRIAREIHDNVGHMLTRSILQTGAVLTINKDNELQPHIKGIKDTLDMAMTSIRSSVHDLHDEAIDLHEAIKETTKAMNKYKVTIDFDISNEVPINVKYCLISVVKEATSNIIKHSNADIVKISLRDHPAFFRLAIEDNGTNCKKINIMNNNIDERDGIGLSNIKERVASFNGTININIEKGFRIIICIPK